jgi:hypothetical protein
MDTDEALAMEFLAGRFEQHGDKISFKCLDPGSPREKQAQQALVWLLRNGQPLADIIRWRIAALLDPEHQFEHRQFVIAFRKKGKRPNHTRDTLIARYIAAELKTGRDMESTIAEVKKRYGVSRAHVLRVRRRARSERLTKDRGMSRSQVLRVSRQARSVTKDPLN